MAEKSTIQKSFSGGITTVGEKTGEPNSASFIKGLEIYENTDYITLARAATKISSTTVADLIRWFADGSPWNTNRYAYDEAGKIYQINSSDTVSLLQTTSSSNGEGLLVWDNALYYATTTDIGKYFPLDNSPSFNDTFSSWWLNSQIQQTGGGTGAADYVPPTSISEAATARQTFTADHDPIVSITIDVDVVGTGNWTVTLHDSNNNSLGSSTIVNGSMSTGDVTFTLSSIARVIPGEDYHFHVTSTVADGGVDTSTATNLEAAEFTIQYQALVSATFHPMVEFLTGWAVGNERYIGYFDGVTYDPTKLTLAPGFEVRSLTKINEYLVIEAWKGQSFSEAEEGRRYFWDGISTTFNFFEDLKIGVPNSIENFKNTLVGVYGNRGSVYSGSGESIEEIVDEMPKLAKDKVIEVYPGAIDVFENRLVIGVSASTDDGTALEQGIYQFGTQTDKIPYSLNFPFLLSTGTTQSTTVKIGAIKSFGKDLYIGWRDDSSYGIDKITAGDSALTTGATWESRIFDAGNPDEYIQAVRVEITFEALASGESVTPKWELDRAGSFTTGTAASTVGNTSVKGWINTACKEIKFGFNVASSSGTFPKITSVILIYDDLGGEEN